MIAAGPFTAPGDLAYGPLQALLAFVAKSRPGLLLLLGPFVDAEHPAIAGGLVERTFEDIFEQEARRLPGFCLEGGQAHGMQQGQAATLLQLSSAEARRCCSGCQGGHGVLCCRQAKLLVLERKQWA